MTTDVKKLRELLTARERGWPFPSEQALVTHMFALLDELERLRQQNQGLRGLVSELADNDTYETEYDGRIYSICHGCGAQDGEPHRRPDCLYIRARAALNPTEGANDAEV